MEFIWPLPEGFYGGEIEPPDNMLMCCSAIVRGITYDTCAWTPNFTFSQLGSPSGPKAILGSISGQV